MTRTQANKLIFAPHNYNISVSGSLYQVAGKQVGICYFDWTTRELQQINIVPDWHGSSVSKEIQALCLLHDITVKEWVTSL